MTGQGPDGLLGAAAELAKVGPRLVGRTLDQLAVAGALLERLPCLARPSERPAARSRDAALVDLHGPAPEAPTPAPEVMPESPAIHNGDSLAIPGYDSLAASQVIPRLGALDPDELEAVRAYEAAHRGRRTILGRIQQLQQP